MNCSSRYTAISYLNVIYLLLTAFYVKPSSQERSWRKAPDRKSTESSDPLEHCKAVISLAMPGFYALILEPVQLISPTENAGFSKQNVVRHQTPILISYINILVRN
jgi:hypothetical protein